jgi:hypothetical protein
MKRSREIVLPGDVIGRLARANVPASGPRREGTAPLIRHFSRAKIAKAHESSASALEPLAAPIGAPAQLRPRRARVSKNQIHAV